MTLSKSNWVDTRDIEKVANLLKTKSVLIIDDDEDFLRSTKEALEKCGFRVITTVNIFTFFRLIGENRLSSIIVDWKIPEGGGQDVMRELVKCDRRYKIGIVSSSKKNELPELPNGVAFFCKSDPDFKEKICAYCKE